MQNIQVRPSRANRSAWKRNPLPNLLETKSSDLDTGHEPPILLQVMSRVRSMYTLCAKEWLQSLRWKDVKRLGAPQPCEEVRLEQEPTPEPARKVMGLR